MASTKYVLILKSMEKVISGQVLIGSPKSIEENLKNDQFDDDIDIRVKEEEIDLQDLSQMFSAIEIEDLKEDSGVQKKVSMPDEKKVSMIEDKK